VRILSAPWLTRAASDGAAQMSFDTWTDLLSLDLAIRQGSYLARAADLAIGRTTLIVSDVVALEAGQPFTLDSGSEHSSGRHFVLGVAPVGGHQPLGSQLAELVLRLDGQPSSTVTLRLRDHRSRLWLIPGSDELIGVVLTPRPTGGQAPTASQLTDELSLEVLLVRADWKRPDAPRELKESDFPTWVDPFGGLDASQVAAFLAPIASGNAGEGEVVFSHRFKAREGELVSLDWSRPESGRRGRRAEPKRETLSLSASLRAVPDTPYLRQAVLTLQSAGVDSDRLVLFRQMALRDDEIRAWVLPLEDQLFVVFARLRPL
jgi:hypothetical protein